MISMKSLVTALTLVAFAHPAIAQTAQPQPARPGHEKLISAAIKNTKRIMPRQGQVIALGFCGPSLISCGFGSNYTCCALGQGCYVSGGTPYCAK